MKPGSNDAITLIAPIADRMIMARGDWSHTRYANIAAGVFFLIGSVVLPATPRPLCAQDYASQLPRIAPTEADRVLETFRVAPPFRLQLVAAEPLVNSPVAIEWDADGNLFVCEMRGYSENRDDALSRVSRLRDTNDDGIYDENTVFADGLLWPTAIFPYDDGLFVADAPDIYFMRDTDGDGIADEKRVVLTGFGTSNVQGLLNSFRWGLDNRIHVACSSAGGKVHSPDHPDQAVDVRGRDLAIDPRTMQFELTSGGGQHGMCFDDWGHKFVSSNSDHIQQVLYDDRYIARNPFLLALPHGVRSPRMAPRPRSIASARSSPGASCERTCAFPARPVDPSKASPGVVVCPPGRRR